MPRNFRGDISWLDIHRATEASNASATSAPIQILDCIDLIEAFKCSSEDMAIKQIPDNSAGFIASANPWRVFASIRNWGWSETQVFSESFKITCSLVFKGGRIHLYPS